LNSTQDAGAQLEVGEARRRREAAPAGPLRGPWRLAQLHGSGNQNSVPQNGAQVRFESPLAVLLCGILNLWCCFFECAENEASSGVSAVMIYLIRVFGLIFMCSKRVLLP